jgi:phosphoribosyl 1,2-cyclic phosphodiesterase
MLRFASLGSGSQGNATLVCSGTTRVLVDCGFSLKEVQQRLARLGLTADALDALLVTHEHSDHVRGAGPLARRYGLPVFMTPGTHASGRCGAIPQLCLINSYQAFEVGDICIQPVPVPHDAQEPSQFVLQAGGKKLGLLTDLGSITVGVLEAYQGCDGLFVEANHDPIMLASGPYPPSLKRRVAGQWGHLSNAQTANLLRELDTSRLQRLVVGHISQTNNSLSLAQAALASLLPHLDIHFACQNQGFDWVQLQ